MKETIIEIGTILLVTWFALSWIVHFFGFYYLEMIYNKDSSPVFGVSFEMMSPYKKPVKPKHEWIKKLTDFTLKLIGINFVLAMVFGVLVAVFGEGK